MTHSRFHFISWCPLASGSHTWNNHRCLRKTLLGTHVLPSRNTSLSATVHKAVDAHECQRLFVCSIYTSTASTIVSEAPQQCSRQTHSPRRARYVDLGLHIRHTHTHTSAELLPHTIASTRGKTRGRYFSGPKRLAIAGSNLWRGSSGESSDSLPISLDESRERHGGSQVQAPEEADVARGLLQSLLHAHLHHTNTVHDQVITCSNALE